MAILKYESSIQLVVIKTDPHESALEPNDVFHRMCILHDNKENGFTETKRLLTMFGKSELLDTYTTEEFAHNVNPYICHINYQLFVYFGEDCPVLKSKTSKNRTPHYKKWTSYGMPTPGQPYYYLEVKEPDKLFKFSNTYKFMYETRHEKLLAQNNQYICRFNMSDAEYQSRIEAKVKEDLEKHRQREREMAELESRKATPGFCSRCGCSGAMLTVNPFNAEIYDDYTKEWLCSDCYDSLLGDI